MGIRRLLAGLLLIGWASAASAQGLTTMTVLDSTGATKTYRMVTDSSNRLSQTHAICDPTTGAAATTNCATVTSGALSVAAAAVNTATVATWDTSTALNTTQSIANSGNYPNTQITLSASANVAAGAVTFQGVSADGTVETIAVSNVLNKNTLAPLTNPYMLTTSKQDFLILNPGYQSIQLKLTTAITTSSGNGSTVISSTLVPYPIPPSVGILNPLVAGSAIVGQFGIDQTTPGTTNGIVNNPTSASGSALTDVVCGSAVSSCVLKASAGNFYGAYAECTSACWLMLFNSTSAPSNGATTAGKSSGNLVECIDIAAASSKSLTYPAFPVAFSVGITAAISSTACGILTLSTVGFVHGTVK